MRVLFIDLRFLRGWLASAQLMLASLLMVTFPVQAEWITKEQHSMGTQVTVSLWHEDAKKGELAAGAVMAEMRRIDETYSPWIESSELARLNAQAAKHPVQVSEELALLIGKSLWYSDISDGAFDITFASVGWYYDYRNKVQPSSAQRANLLPAVNYKLLKFDKKERRVSYGHPNIRIDLGGIAKGLAVDNAVRLMQQYGVAHGTVSAGGDSRVLGDKRGQPWVVGIKNPRVQSGEKAEPIIFLPLENTAVSTSGDYERYFIDESSGERIHHIINPRTGKSAQGVISVTILADEGIDSDPLSTTVFVLGVEKGLELVNGLQGVDCVIIDSLGKVHYSAGLTPPE